MNDALVLAEDLSNLPELDTEGEWREFWHGTANGELKIQACKACGHKQFYPRYLCTECGATDLEYVRASGRGTVHTFSIVEQNRGKPFKEMLPYAVTIIELDEGVRMMTNVVGCAVDDLHIGMRVGVFFREVHKGQFIPYWSPLEAQED